MTKKAKALLAVTGAALAAVLTLGTALAETATGQTTQQNNYRQTFVQRLAAILGIDQAKLEAAVRQAGGDVISEAERNGDISKNRADALRKRLEQDPWSGWHWGKGYGYGFGGHHRSGPFGHWLKGTDGTGLDAAAAALGITRDELQKQLQDGKTLGEIADARGVARRKVQDALIASYKQKLADAVKNGDLTQKQADQMLQRLESMNILDKPMWRCRSW